LDCSNSEIKGSNPAQVMNICPRGLYEVHKMNSNWDVMSDRPHVSLFLKLLSGFK